MRNSCSPNVFNSSAKRDQFSSVGSQKNINFKTEDNVIVEDINDNLLRSNDDFKVIYNNS